MSTTDPSVEEIAETRRMLRESAASFCQQDLPVGRLRDLRENSSSFDREVWQKMAELGWLGLLVPEDNNGMGLQLGDMAAVVEELGKVAAPEPLLEVAVLATRCLSESGRSNDIAKTLLGELVIGKTLPIVAWQEDSHTLNSNSPTLQAREDASGYELHGTKCAIPAANVADGFIVSAMTSQGLGLFWVTADTIGLTLTTQTLADDSLEGHLTFDHALVPADQVIALGEAAENALERALDETRAIAAVYLLGLMQQSMDLTIDYLKTRKQFGRHIGSFQALQHRAVDLYMHWQLARSVIDEVLPELEHTPNLNACALLSSRAKYRANESARIITRESVQMHGGIGYTDECDVGLYLNRGLVLAARMGNTSWLTSRISRVSPYIVESIEKGDYSAISEPADGDYNSMSDDDFRILIRSWLESEYPEDMRYPTERFHWPQVKNWYFKQSKKGWLAPAWPQEYGGMGLDAGKLIIFIEEQERWGVGRAPDQGIIMVGPLLIKHGTEEQRAKYLPKIISGEHIWCQGYSEPNSGSDLASLRTEAVLDGDEFVVNGQKTWTTMAMDANHMFLLARTDKSAKKQQGISFLLLDFDTPGVTIRPIRNIAGHEEFCEVFLDNVRIPKENLVGEMNDGWTMAKALLGFERLFLGSPKQSQYAMQRTAEAANAAGLFDDAAFLDRFTRARLDVMDLQSTFSGFAEIVKKGGTLGPDISLVKIWGTETFARWTEIFIETCGTSGAYKERFDLHGATVDTLSSFYNARPATIYGGSNEIQRNILAKAILGLPSN